MSNPVILQDTLSAESRAIRMAAMLMENQEVMLSPIERLQDFRDMLLRGALPVGSVEFVRLAMRIAGIAEPANMSYPPQIHSFLKRSIWHCTASAVQGRFFVKPTTTKCFTGFILDSAALAESLSEHDAEQLAEFKSMPAGNLVWVSDVVAWVSEWRYYIMGATILGSARYDSEGHDDAPSPCLDVVRACVATMGLGHPYVLDFGVLANGETALVEANDAFAIGLYRGALSPRQYLAFLQARWSFLRGAPL